MSVAEIKALPLREKLQIMEEIWLELREQVADMGTPDEHMRVLNTRRERVESGSSKLYDWDEVKSQIGRK